ncbi:MAG TPA: TauD/TfdA family dioxygenase [Pseudonocardiaceae bacterium]|nr:TauD/TfdA family dioxygenase [Pseudonocardiaceae bacterium]
MIKEVGGAAGWLGGQLTDSAAWRFPLTAAHRAELLADPASLPTLGPVLERLGQELCSGRGFALLQGVPVTGLTESEVDAMAVGIAGHVGVVVPPVVHVRDVGVDRSESTSKSYQHNGRLGYHSDPTDVVALLCVRRAVSGGLSSVVSSVAVHDEVVRTRPELAEVLYDQWWRDARTGDGVDSFYQQPVYRLLAGKLVANYGPDYIHSAQRGAHVPALRPDQLAAMAELDRLNDDPRFVLTMDLQAGDMQFLNNRVTMHSRTEYRDDPARRRDLIRIWLNFFQR